jgi:hypothetical protein
MLLFVATMCCIVLLPKPWHQQGTTARPDDIYAVCCAAGTPEAAQSFLVELATKCHEQADQEVAMLTQLKRQHTHDSGKLADEPINT